MERKSMKRIIKISIISVICFVILLAIIGVLIPNEPIGDKIALIEINGSIYSSKGVIEEIHKYRDDDSVKGIVIRLNSPGGIVAPAQEIYRELKKTNKLIVASLGSVAASGAYYIACAANKIFANPGTLTGSIGVVIYFPKIQELSKKIGIDREVIKSGKFKDSGSMYRDLTPEERQIFQSTVNDVYEQFIDAIVDGRKHTGLTREEILRLSDGRVMSGRQALKSKLVDELGDLQDAIEYAGKTTGLGERPKIVKKKERKPLIYRLLGVDLQKDLFSMVEDQISIRYEMIH